MDAVSKTEQLKRIRSELIHGSYLARQLQTNIRNDSSSSQESIRIFIEGLLNSCSVSISMLTSLELPKHRPLPRMPPGSHSRRAKSAGDNHNPVPEDAGCKANAQSCNNKSRKRKCVKRVTQVTLTEGAGLETALEDGYSWRKYGQKHILGSRYPRGYYRCTHKTTECCSARKQIQRIDDEQGPPVFTITLFGDHSCSHHQQLQRTSQLSSPPPSIPLPDQHAHHQENDIFRHLEPYIEPVISRSAHRVNYEFGYHTSIASGSTWFSDYSQTEMLHQQTEFDPFYDILNWDFSG